MNLTEVLARDGKVIEAQAQLEMDTFTSKLGQFPISEKSLFSFTITNLGKRKIAVTGSGDVTLVIPCDRCLSDTATTIHLEMDQEFDLELLEEGLDAIEDENAITGYNLDVDQLVYNEILVNLPAKILCKEDCQGICSKCGAKTGTCDCDTAVLDPRMAVIQDIFKNNKEV